MRLSKLAKVRRSVAKKGAEARWGVVKRSPSRQIRVDESAYSALLEVPERDRRMVASGAIIDAVGAYHAVIDAIAKNC